MTSSLGEYYTYWHDDVLATFDKATDVDGKTLPPNAIKILKKIYSYIINMSHIFHCEYRDENGTLLPDLPPRPNSWQDLDGNKWTKLTAFIVLDEALNPGNPISVSNPGAGCINIVDVIREYDVVVDGFKKNFMTSQMDVH